MSETCQALVPMNDGWERVCRQPHAESWRAVAGGVPCMVVLCEAHAELADASAKGTRENPLSPRDLPFTAPADGSYWFDYDGTKETAS